MDVIAIDCSTGERVHREATVEEAAQKAADEAAYAAWLVAPKPLDRLGVAYTYDVVIGVRQLADAAAALVLPEQALIDEAKAWEYVAALEALGGL